MNFEKDFKYEIEQPFEYALNGESKQAMHLIVKMPTGRLREYTAIIDQEFQKASAYIENNYSNIVAQNNNKKEAKTLEKDSYKSISKILAAGNSDLNKCYTALNNILSYKIGKFCFCEIDGATPFGRASFDSLSIKDINNILGRFIEYFL